MDVEEALLMVEQALNPSGLSNLQVTVLRQVWEERSYQEIAHLCGYEVGYVKQTGSQLWQLLSQALGEKVSKSNIQSILRRYSQRRGSLNHPAILAPCAPAALPPQPTPAIGLKEVPDSSVFFGRTAELQILKRSLLQDRCRLVGVFGMGGMGKTSLCAKLTKDIAVEFECVVWRSLHNAPPIRDLLSDLLQCLSQSQSEPNLATNPATMPQTIEKQLLVLIDYCRTHRCLLILDNMETLLQPGDRSGHYRAGYEGYAQLLKCWGESDHQSALLLTSREKPVGFAIQEGETLPIRSLQLTGLPPQIGQEILNVKGRFSGASHDWKVLVNHYGGNPLALKMLAPVIKDFFAGNVAHFLEFLEPGTSVFGDIHELLTCQVARLSVLEHQVMYWLAIHREPVAIAALRADFVSQVSVNHLLEALASLERRSLIEKTQLPLSETNCSLLTLQPVVMEYMTDRLIEQACQEIAAWDNQAPQGATLPLLRTHALIQAQAKDYIRETQTRLILQPIAVRLLASSSLEALLQKFRQILADLRGKPAQTTGYIAGNLLNLLVQLQVDLTSWDFSDLTVWQAYLKRVNLHQANFARSDLANCVFTQPFSQVLSVAFSPNGRLLATGDVNHEIHVWQVAEGKQLLTCKVEQGWVWSVVFSPDGRWLASSANRVVHLWDLHTGQCLQTFTGYSDRVFSLAFSPDGRFLASGSEDHLIRIWDLRSGQLYRTLAGHTDEVRSIAFSPQFSDAQQEDYWLASGSYDGTVRLWDVTTGECLHSLKDHTGWVWSVAFSPDGQQLASSSSDRTLKLWNLSQFHTLNQVRLVHSLSGHTQSIRAVAFSPDGTTLASGSDDQSIRFWHSPTGECLSVLPGHTSWISSLAFSPDASLLASGSEDQSVRLWNSRTHACCQTLQGHSNGVWSAAFHPQRMILASGSQDRVVRLWNLQTGKCYHSFPGHKSWIWSVAFSPDGNFLASGSEDHTIQLWHLETGQRHQLLQGHTDAVFSVIFSPDGQTLLSGSLDGTIKQWNLHTGECHQTWQGHTGGIWFMALSADGQLLASASQDQTIKLWHVPTGHCVQTLLGHDSWVRCVAISPDQQTLLGGSADGVIKQWEIPTKHCQQTIQAHQGPVLSVAFHPNGRSFASSGADAVVKLWDLSLGQCCQILREHDKWVRFLTFSPDGQTLASCSQDEAIKLWQLQSQIAPQIAPKCVATLRVRRPYEGMNISGTTGLSATQIAALQMLGAVEPDDIPRDQPSAADSRLSSNCEAMFIL
ncbi:MAG TPA: NB-ARC domain-containing protein [Candidatus Obscuribacterales bacterium]